MTHKIWFLLYNSKIAFEVILKASTHFNETWYDLVLINSLLRTVHSEIKIRWPFTET